MLKNIFSLIICYNFLLSSVLYGDNISPVNNSILNYVHVLFEWEQIPDALEYRLQVSTESDFSVPVTDTTVSSLIYIDKENIEWSSNYFWRIKPVYNNYGVFGRSRMRLVRILNVLMQQPLYIITRNLIQG